MSSNPYKKEELGIFLVDSYYFFKQNLFNILQTAKSDFFFIYFQLK